MTEIIEIYSPYIPFISLAISIVAIMPSIYSLVKKIFSKITCDFYGYQEVGYTRFGPQLALYSVFRALKSNLYIKNLEIEIIHIEQNRRIVIYMWTLRILKISASSTTVQKPTLYQSVSLDIASGFIISEAQEVKKHIVFVPDARMNPELDPLNDLEDDIRNEYSSFFREKLMQWGKTTQMIVGENVDAKAYIEEFLQRPNIRAISEKIVEKCWWKEGTYKGVIRIRTSNPNKLFEEKFSFHLDKANIASLASNANLIIAEFCEKLFSEYNFVYLKFNQ